MWDCLAASPGAASTASVETPPDAEPEQPVADAVAARDRVTPKRHQPSSIDLTVLALTEFFRQLGSDGARELALRFCEHFAGTTLCVPSDPAPAMLRNGMKAAEIVAKYPHVQRTEPLGPQNYEDRLDALGRFLGENPRQLESQGRRYLDLWRKTESIAIGDFVTPRTLLDSDAGGLRAAA